MKFKDLPYEDKMKVLEAVKRRPLKRAWRPKKQLRSVLTDLGCEFYRAGKQEGCARMVPLFLIDQIKDWLEEEEQVMYNQL